MQRNLFLVGIALFVILFMGVVFFKKRIVPVGSTIQKSQSVTPSRSPNASPSSVPAKANIIVSSPKPNDTVQFPVIVSGTARVFESQLNYRIKDGKENILSQGHTTANAPDAGQFGPFTVTIQNLGDITSGKISIEVFDVSQKDGSEIDNVQIPVVLQ